MSHEPRVVFQPLHEDVICPTRQTGGSAGFDVHAYLKDRVVMLRRGATSERREVATADGRLVLEPGDIALVPTEFKARVPAGYEAQVRIRSSMAFERGLILPNAPGTIDADYPDEWLVMVKNDSAQTAEIEHGERIAQVILSRFAVLPWTSGAVDASTERRGGLGSTGAA